MPTYTVKRGDTLYQIALDNGLDYRELAAWNNIENINVIRVGQVLRLDGAGRATAAGEAGPGVTTAPLRTAPPVGRAGERRSRGRRRRPAAAQSRQLQVVAEGAEGAVLGAGGARGAAPRRRVGQRPARRQRRPNRRRRRAQRRRSSPAPSRPDAKPDAGAAAERRRRRRKLDWMWPAEGQDRHRVFRDGQPQGHRHRRQGGPAGVRVSAAGKVVYAGTGLRGYGKLIIIKHNTTYLSAYAHNKRHPGQGRPAGDARPEDRRNGQHRQPTR